MNEYETTNQNFTNSTGQNFTDSTGGSYGYSTESDKNSKLLKGIVIGGVIGGILTLLDSSTRSSLKGTVTDVKNGSKSLFTEVKSNPTEVKETMMSQFQSASNVLKDAIADAQSLYDRLNGDLFGKVSEVKDISKDAINTVMGVKGEVKSIGSKVAEAGSELKAGVLTTSSTDTSSNSTLAGFTTTGSSESEFGMASGSLTGSSGQSDVVEDETYSTGYDRATTKGSTSTLGETDSTTGGSYGDSGTRTDYGMGNSSESLGSVTDGDAFANEGSGGLGYSNSDGSSTTGGMETPFHDKDEKKNS